ncbi:hypothetical protein [Streptomyces sp. NEAU-W12]|uniref:hypothetical protein n=1 Tax=Streptomyces sp. NEAU-W12 TaxID=2994668 RepID=UPI00224A9639|nr:hypothetical protein [Streptomyces sp. NEAU-W12]MCX2927350.1 hypothetical protein [Streptomyces sp. NEAU-W12]
MPAPDLVPGGLGDDRAGSDAGASSEAPAVTAPTVPAAHLGTREGQANSREGTAIPPGAFRVTVKQAKAGERVATLRHTDLLGGACDDKEHGGPWRTELSGDRLPATHGPEVYALPAVRHHERRHGQALDPAIPGSGAHASHVTSYGTSHRGRDRLVFPAAQVQHPLAR